jgi:hypothetical protein
MASAEFNVCWNILELHIDMDVGASVATASRRGCTGWSSTRESERQLGFIKHELQLKKMFEDGIFSRP